MTTTDVMQKVQLVNSVFTPSEAIDVVNALIKQKINFHKIKMLSMCEGDMNSDITYDNGRVSQLLKEKEEFKAICKEARMNGKKLKISGILDVEMID
jgi:anionic cell wall polymer biosynthesis LytR-Cps2A-Psr (LCP) family protein